MNKHVTLLGSFYIAMGALDILAAIIIMVVMVGAGIASGDVEAMQITSAVGSGIASLLLIFAVPEIICGVGLLRGASWSRVLGLIMSFANLLGIPLGTLLGGYGIWVLFHDETEKVLEAQRLKEQC